MKRLYSILVMAMLALSMTAQGFRPQQGFQPQQQRFSPERFETELRNFIIKEASLSQEEADKFFPVYKEMQDKQRILFIRQRELAKSKPADEQGCLRVIRESDEIDLELKRIQQNYHKRFLQQLSASKLYDVLQAEQRFHRRIMRQWGGRGSFGFGGGGQHLQPFQR